MQVLAQKDGLDGPPQFKECLEGWVLKIASAKSAQNRIGFGSSQAEGRRIFDDLVVFTPNTLPINRSLQDRLEIGVGRPIAALRTIEFCRWMALNRGINGKPKT